MYNDELYHHGILGQKWGVRRFQNYDGTLKEQGKNIIGGIIRLLTSGQRPMLKKMKPQKSMVMTVDSLDEPATKLTSLAKKETKNGIRQNTSLGKLNENYITKL